MCFIWKTLNIDEESLQWRNGEYWKFKNITITIPKGLNELWLNIAYGYTGYGMPVAGFESNFQNIAYYYMNSFR